MFARFSLFLLFSNSCTLPSWLQLAQLLHSFFSHVVYLTLNKQNSMMPPFLDNVLITASTPTVAASLFPMSLFGKHPCAFSHPLLSNHPAPNPNTHKQEAREKRGKATRITPQQRMRRLPGEELARTAEEGALAGGHVLPAQRLGQLPCRLNMLA